MQHFAGIRLTNLFAPNRSFRLGHLDMERRCHQRVYAPELPKDVLHKARFVLANPNFQTDRRFGAIDKT
jgi:hypothetical protein